MESFEEMRSILTAMGKKARNAGLTLSTLPYEVKRQALENMAYDIEHSVEIIKGSNEIDLAEGRKKNLSPALLDRLTLTDDRIKTMAIGLREVAAQVDPVGKVLSEIKRPNGLKITKISVPFGVIGIIYESRPNVTVDAAGICISAGNAVILRGGSEAFNSNCCLAGILEKAAVRSGLPSGSVQLLPWKEHEAVNIMLKLDQYIDLIIPRGGERLIRTVVAEATMPVLKHYKGVCHLFVDSDCDVDMAVNVVENAKCSRPGVCNALETLLIDRKIAAEFIPPFVEAMEKNKVELRGDEEFCSYYPNAKTATEDDYFAEYISLILAIRIVDGVEAAVDHINHYGSRHSDGILSRNEENIQYFYGHVDSSTVYANASTRFTDGGEFGMGAEIGISTDKLHARGPMGAAELVSYKYLVRGNGQVRK